MHRIALILAVAGWLVVPAAGAEQEPAAGKLLVATEDLRGEVFARTVVLVLRYDDTGAMGLIVNRPTSAAPAELLSEEEAPADYRGKLYWGGPVEMGTVRALQLTDAPPEGAMPIVDAVHQVPIDAALSVSGADAATLRFFVGYAGWAPGQLERELALGSWHVVPATEELVFTDEPQLIWQRLTPAREYRANYQLSELSGRPPGRNYRDAHRANYRDTHNNYRDTHNGRYQPGHKQAGAAEQGTGRPAPRLPMSHVLWHTVLAPDRRKGRSRAEVNSRCIVSRSVRVRGGTASRHVACCCRPRRSHGR